MIVKLGNSKHLSSNLAGCRVKEDAFVILESPGSNRDSRLQSSTGTGNHRIGVIRDGFARCQSKPFIAKSRRRTISVIREKSPGTEWRSPSSEMFCSIGELDSTAVLISFQPSQLSDGRERRNSLITDDCDRQVLRVPE